MKLFGMVDGVFGYGDRHVSLRQYGLAAQARVGLQSPGAVQQVVLHIIRRIQGGKAIAHDHMASGASCAHVAGVLDVDFVFKQRLTY